MIEGSLTDESGTIRPGNVAYRPDGCVHSNTSPNGALALAIIAGGNEPATEIGDELSQAAPEESLRLLRAALADPAQPVLHGLAIGLLEEMALHG